MSHLPPDFLHEDAHILVLNKPVGLNVHQGNKEEKTLVDYLLEANVPLAVGQEGRPGIVHRLDKLTEGVMVLAKSDLAYSHLIEQFKQKDIQKKYLAMVYGDIKHDHLSIDKPIKRHPSKRFKMICHPDGKPSMSEVAVLKRYNSKTLVEVRPITGRTHQIRVHMQSVQHPIVGDPVYFKSKPGEGQLLQAQSLSFIHPTKGNRLTFTMPPSSRLFGKKRS